MRTAQAIVLAASAALALPARAQWAWPAQRVDARPTLQGSRDQDQANPSLAAFPSGMFLAWVESVERPRLPDVHGAVLAPDGTVVHEFVVAAGGRYERELSVACSEAACAVVWHQVAHAADDSIWWQRFDFGGTPLGPAALLSAAPRADRDEPAIAWNAASAAWGIAWLESEIHVSVFDAAGVPLRASVLLGDGLLHEDHPTLAAAGDGFLVSWEHTSQVMLAQVPARGDDAGTPQVVTDAGVYSFYPSITPSADGGAALVSWLEYQGTSYGDPFARRFDATGAPLDLDKVMLGPSTAGSYGRPQSFFDGTRWVVAWAHESSAPRRTWTAAVDALSGGAVLLDQQGGGVEMGYADVPLALVGSSAGGLLVFRDKRLHLDANLWADPLSPSGQFLGDGGFPLFPGATGQRALAIGASGEDFLAVVGRAAPGLVMNAEAVLLGPDGVPRGAPRVLAPASVGRQNLAAMAFDGTRWVVVLREADWGGPIATRALVLDASGTPLAGSEVLLQGFDLVNVPGLAVAATPSGTWVLLETADELYGSRWTAAGGWSAAPVRRFYTPADGYVRNPTLSVARDHMLLVWVGDGATRALRLDFDGVPLGAAATVDADPSYLAYRAASDGTDHLVTFVIDAYTTQVLGFFVVSGATGAALVRRELVTATQLDFHEGVLAPPDVAWDGQRYVVTWEEHSIDGGSAALWAWVAPDGTELQRGLVADGPYDELSPQVAAANGRAALLYSAYDPDAGAQRVFVSVLASATLGQPCLLAAECGAVLECRAGRCCESDGGCDGPLAPDAGGGPRALRVQCGCESGPGAALLALLAFARAVTRRAPR